MSLYRRMVSPSTEGPTMEDQVKREFAVTNKLSPVVCPIYPSSSQISAFPAPKSGGGRGHGSPNSSTESTSPLTNEGSQINTTAETDGFINYNVHEEEERADEDDYFNSFPPGYRFKPLDEELVVHYLRKKIYNQVLPRNKIKEVELYKYNPDTLAANYRANGEDEWYFFTPRDRKYPNGDRPNRAAGDGYWKATGADKPIKFRGTKVGLKKSLVFYTGKPPRGDKTDWIMHEYKLIDAPKRRKVSQDDMKLDDWVLCKIRKKDKPDKTVKAVPGLSCQENEGPLQPENVSTYTPIINCVDSDIVYSYHNGISEPVDLRFYQDHVSSAYPQQMMSVAAHNNFVPWIDNIGLSSSPLRIPFHHTMQVQTPYDHLIHPPPIQRLGSLGFEPTELDQMLQTLTDEKDAKKS